MALRVTSEVGRLREVIVHRPGRELVRMTPSTRDYFLFDDLLFDDHAQQEHDWLTELLRDHLGIKVHSFEDLLVEALASASRAERHALVSQVCRVESDIPAVEQRIGQLEVMVRWFQGHGWPQYTQDPEADPKADAPSAPGAQPGSLTALLQQRDTSTLSPERVESLDYVRHRLQSWSDREDFKVLSEELVGGVEARVGGVSPSGEPGPDGNGFAEDDADALRRFVEGRLFHLTPLPNLMFVRDSAMVINNRLLLSRMAAPGRTREPLLFDFVQRNHPTLKESQRWTWADARINDPAWPFVSSPTLRLEGGNVLQLRDNLIVLGVSQRTTLEAVQRLSDAWRAHAAEAGKRLVLYVLRLPAGVNHLDSVFGPLSESECVVYPPVFEPYGPASVDVVRAELGEGPVRPTRSADFFESLRRDGLDLTPIPCGGTDPMDQQREQWFSAANLLALAPGKVLIYRSCERTVAELERHGYDVVDINDVQTGGVKLDLDGPGKWVLKIKGSELSRGHGGPRSLVLPLVREVS